MFIITVVLFLHQDTNYWFAAKLTFITYLPVFLACIHLLLVYFLLIGQYSLGVFSEGREIDGSPFIFDYKDAQGSYSVNVSTSGNYEGSLEAKLSGSSSSSTSSSSESSSSSTMTEFIFDAQINGKYDLCLSSYCNDVEGSQFNGYLNVASGLGISLSGNH